MLVIIGTIRLPPANLDAARPIMQRMVEASRAEPDCVEYSYAEDVLEPGLIRVTEVWRSREGLEAHFRTPHIAAWRAAWPALGITDRRLVRYAADEGEAT